MQNYLRRLLMVIYIFFITSVVSLLFASFGKYLSDKLSMDFIHSVFILIGFCLGALVALMTSDIFKYESLNGQWEKYEFLYILRDQAGIKKFKDKQKQEQHLKKIQNKYRHKNIESSKDTSLEDNSTPPF